MKKYIILIITIALCSCSEQLEPRLSTSVDADQVVTDLNSLNLAVNGLYDNLQPEEYYNRTLLLVPELLSDNAMIDAFDNAGRYVDYDNFVVNANDADATDLWDFAYTSIASTSIVIREAHKVDFPEGQLEEANQYIGEAYALRGLSYLNLQLFYAQPYNSTVDASHMGIPLVDQSLAGGVEIIKPSRSTTHEVFVQIEQDLKEAVKLLGEDAGPFRINLFAAKALLARTYMHMENWEGVKQLTTEVINEGGYDLVANDSYVDSWGQDENPETIFSIVNTLTDNEGSNSISYFYLRYEDAFATDNFVGSFTETDVRKLLYPYDDDAQANLITKYPKGNTSDDNLQVVRLSEIYLMKAEAHARLNETIAAQNALDVVVSRADPTAIASTESGQELIDKIIQERRKELAFEGFRLFDLTRNGISYVKFRQGATDIPIDFPNTNTILPIPQDEINRNSNINEEHQNPGY